MTAESTPPGPRSGREAARAARLLLVRDRRAFRLRAVGRGGGDESEAVPVKACGALELLRSLVRVRRRSVGDDRNAEGWRCSADRWRVRTSSGFGAGGTPLSLLKLTPPTPAAPPAFCCCYCCCCICSSLCDSTVAISPTFWCASAMSSFKV